MFLGYSHEVKGYRVWNLNSKRLEITRSVTFQELPKSKYVQVIGDIPVNTRMHHDDDDDVAMVRLSVLLRKVKENRWRWIRLEVISNFTS